MLSIEKMIKLAFWLFVIVAAVDLFDVVYGIFQHLDTVHMIKTYCGVG